MSDLEDTFGEEFAQNYKQTIAARREQRQSLTDEARKAIANKAVNEGGFDGDEPYFNYTTEEGITHDVLLMKLPNPDKKHIFTYTNDLDNGAVTCPLDYLDEWMSCLFNEKEVLQEMEPGEYYIVAGNLDTWEDDSGEVNDQMSPVRGVIGLEEAKKLADEYLSDSGINEEAPTETEEGGEDEDEAPSFSSDEEEEEKEVEEEDDDDSGMGGLDFGGGSDEEEDSGVDVDRDELEDVVDSLGEKEEAVWEIEEGDDRLDKLAEVAANKLGMDHTDEGVTEAVAEEALDYIESEREEEEEDGEEDALF